MALHLVPMIDELARIVERLRQSGTDFTSVEVKSAVGGFPQSVLKSMSALANLPGGGIVILGLDEQAGFAAVQLHNVPALKRALGSKARHFIPPIRIDVEDGTVDGKPVVVARIHECDVAHKPCRTSDGRAYIRSWDGDYLASPLEEQSYLLNRTPPRADREAAHGASAEDLDKDLVDLWAEVVARDDPVGLGRFSGDELLRRAGIVTANLIPSIAGLVALGIQPQQHFPRLSLQLARIPRDGARALESVELTGPLPTILDGALEWARRNFTVKTVASGDGHLRDEYDYPLVAFREIVSNALIHRSLDDWAKGMPAEVRVYDDRLIVTNPGGLYGITVDRLGHEAVATSRNASLVAIARHTRSKMTGARVVESLSTGIATVLEQCEKAGLPAPIFQDSGVRFTAVLRKTAEAPAVPIMNLTEASIFALLLEGDMTAAQLAAAAKTGEPNVRKALRRLRELGIVTSEGGRGQRTTYRRTTTTD